MGARGPQFRKPPDVRRLPVWAQEKIDHLERELSQAERKLRETGYQAESPVYYNDGMHDRYYIPPRTTVTFQINPRQHIDCYLADRHEEDGSLVLEIRASGSYASPLHIIPEASNAIHVRPEMPNWLRQRLAQDAKEAAAKEAAAKEAAAKPTEEVPV